MLRIVQPDTVIKWHKMGFKLYWRWKSKPMKSGRPPIETEIRDLIRQMARQNPLWGAPHICSELRLLGYEVAIPRPIQAPSEGNVVAVPHVGGLHRGYRRVA